MSYISLYLPSLHCCVDIKDSVSCKITYKNCCCLKWSEVKVAQSCLTLCNPMDYSLPGSSCPWNSTDKNGVGNCSLLQGIFPTQGSNTGLLHCRWILYHLSLVAKLCPILGDPMESGCQAPLSMGFSSQEYRTGLPCPPPGNLQPSDQTFVSFIGRSVLYHWATREEFIIYLKCHMISILMFLWIIIFNGLIESINSTCIRAARVLS